MLRSIINSRKKNRFKNTKNKSRFDLLSRIDFNVFSYVSRRFSFAILNFRQIKRVSERIFERNVARATRAAQIMKQTKRKSKTTMMLLMSKIIWNFFCEIWMTENLWIFRSIRTNSIKLNLYHKFLNAENNDVNRLNIAEKKIKTQMKIDHAIRRMFWCLYFVVVVSNQYQMFSLFRLSIWREMSRQIQFFKILTLLFEWQNQFQYHNVKKRRCCH